MSESMCITTSPHDSQTKDNFDKCRGVAVTYIKAQQVIYKQGE